MRTEQGLNALPANDTSVTIAGRDPAQWNDLRAHLNWLFDQLRAGTLTLCPDSESRGIIGPQIDGCYRVDIELLLASPPLPVSTRN